MTLTGLEGVYQTLLSLPAEVVSKRGGPVKAALRKGALVILKAEKAELAARIAEVKKEERPPTGLMEGSLVATRGKAPTDGKGERYLVRFKRKTYPGRKGKPTTTLKTAQIYEYGSEKQPARPFIRTAFASRAEEAIRTIERELVAGVDKVVAKLAAQNRSRG